MFYAFVNIYFNYSIVFTSTILIGKILRKFYFYFILYIYLISIQWKRCSNRTQDLWQLTDRWHVKPGFDSCSPVAMGVGGYSNTKCRSSRTQTEVFECKTSVIYVRNENCSFRLFLILLDRVFFFFFIWFR